MASGRILLDILGGDHAPKAILAGALQALPLLKRKLVLIGDEKEVARHKINRSFPGRFEVIHATENIEMTDKVKAIRSKPNAPINVGNRIAAESWRAARKNPDLAPDAFVSAGHSGAMMASALLSMGRLSHVERPAIATKLPTLNGKGVVCLDVGANVDCKAEHLRDFAIMGALFSSATSHGEIKRPKIALLSNGEERTKGNDLTRAAYQLLEGLPCFTGEKAVGEFIGYCEGKEMFQGDVDVVVMDGFVGNLMLKNSEGLGSMIVRMLKREALSNPLNAVGFGVAAAALLSLKKKLDYRETGAAPLLGVGGYSFIAHGRSDAHAIKNALLRAEEALDARMVERLDEAIESIYHSPAPQPGSDSK